MRINEESGTCPEGKGDYKRLPVPAQDIEGVDPAAITLPFYHHLSVYSRGDF